MHSSPVPIGKRPELKQASSAGWSWPRLIPIHEQQSRPSQASQSSASFSLHDHSEQEKPLTTKMIATIISKMHTEEDAPLSPVLSAAGNSPTAGEPVAGTVEHQPYGHPHNSGSSMADSGDEGRRAAGSDSRFVKCVADREDTGSESEPVEDVAERRASALGHGPTKDIAQQSGIDTPVAYENRSKHLATKRHALSG